jgi:hypothetical protein
MREGPMPAPIHRSGRIDEHADLGISFCASAAQLPGEALARALYAGLRLANAWDRTRLHRCARRQSAYSTSRLPVAHPMRAKIDATTVSAASWRLRAFLRRRRRGVRLRPRSLPVEQVIDQERQSV